MKKLTKTFLSVAAVSALTAAMAVSASAMTATYVPGVDGAVNTVKLEGVAATGTSQTMIILNSNDAIVTETMVEAIDQKDKQATDKSNPVFTSVPVNALDNGTYYVRIGGKELVDGTIQEATFTVGDVGPGDETETIVIGDVNDSNSITSMDGTLLARYNAKYTENIGNVSKERTAKDGSKVVIGDVNDSDSITSMDGTLLARYNAKYTENIGNVNQTVEVIK